VVPAFAKQTFDIYKLISEKQFVRYGAIAVLDALGFKGIWNRYEDWRVLKKLKKAKEVAVDKFREGDTAAWSLPLFLDGTHYERFNVWEVRFLSDTMLIAVMPPPGLESPPVEGPVERWRLIQFYFVINDLMYVVANFLNYVGCTCEEPALCY